MHKIIAVEPNILVLLICVPFHVRQLCALTIIRVGGQQVIADSFSARIWFRKSSINSVFPAFSTCQNVQPLHDGRFCNLAPRTWIDPDCLSLATKDPSARTFAEKRLRESNSLSPGFNKPRSIKLPNTHLTMDIICIKKKRLREIFQCCFFCVLFIYPSSMPPVLHIRG